VEEEEIRGDRYEEEQQWHPSIDRWRGRAERSGPWQINYHYPSARNEIVRIPPNVTSAVTGYRARITTHFRSPITTGRQRRRISKMMDNILNFKGNNQHAINVFDFENSQVCQIRDFQKILNL